MDATLSGTHAFKVRTTIPEYHVVNEELHFTISFDCVITDIVASQKPSDLVYFVDPNLGAISSIPMPKFSAVPDYCYANFMITVNTNSTTVTADEFAQIDSSSNTLKLSSKDLSILGTYDMTIQAMEPRRGTSRSVRFNLKMDCQVTKVS